MSCLSIKIATAIDELIFGFGIKRYSVSSILNHHKNYLFIKEAKIPTKIECAFFS